MRTTLLCGAVLASALGPAGPPAEAQSWLVPAAPKPPGLRNAALGMSLEDWKSLPPPASAGPTATPTCWNDDRSAAAAGLPMSTAEAEAGATICTYISRYGRTFLSHSVRIDPGHRVEGVRYIFLRDRLAEISFRASVDAYNDITAMLKDSFGPQASTQRDLVRTSAGRLQRVKKTWRTAAGGAVLTAPAEDATQLSVRLFGPGGGVR